VTATEKVLVFDVDPARGASIAKLLGQADPSRADGDILVFQSLTGHGNNGSNGLRAIQEWRTGLVVVVEADAFAGLAESARKHGVASLLVVDGKGDPREVALRVRGYDGWIRLEAMPSELPARALALLDRRQTGSNLPTIDPYFLALVIHDLRTPLNVIGLTIRAISQTVPQSTPDLEEDLTFLTDNARQIEKMLTQLGDYCRLIEAGSQVSSVEFDPRRFLADFLDDRRSRPGSEPARVSLELVDGGPVEVALDPQRARLALTHALANALNAAGEAPVRIKSGGGHGRWVVEIIVDKPPPPTVSTMELRADRFERLAGSAAERRGLDLAIAARVSEIFGGSSRLEVEPQRRSTIVLDWPERFASP